MINFFLSSWKFKIIALQILKIRAQTETIQIDDDSLAQLGEIGVSTTLR